MQSRDIKLLGIFLVACFGAGRLPACGPYFPNNLLAGGDAAVLVAPVANFQRELERLHLVAPAFLAVPATNGYAEQSTMAELGDLRTALRRAGTPPAEANQIIARHEAERKELQAYVEARKQWENTAPLEWDNTARDYVHGQPQAPPPKFPQIAVAKGLPVEFADYFTGAIAWENPAITNKESARRSWLQVLALPPAQRHFKSTWSAFMLGRSWTRQNPEKAVGLFWLVRELSREGFVDSCGLAAASLGREAQIELRRKDFAKAITLYLEQLKAGSATAVNSLRFAAFHALETKNTARLVPLAANRKTRRVLTAYLISCRPSKSKDALARAWLTAAETVGVKDMASAEELALAAYQSGEWDLAQRWINRAPATPVTQWLQAKLLLRAGKLQQAGAVLAKIAPHFPLATNETNAHPRAGGLKDDLSVPGDTLISATISASQQVRGEEGVIHLARREYVEALDALLRAGFWMDAAYVAERVLNLDELKTYVDRDWPAVSESKRSSTGSSAREAHLRRNIRYLLARRLARANRDKEARAYYPPQWLPQFDALQRALAIGRDKSLPTHQRAEALMAAAFITRTNGMELLGTEDAPDWHIYDGEFSQGVTLRARTNTESRLVPPSRDEIRRAARNIVQPEERFHYRFQAARLAVEAAGLMPDNSEQTARVLCTAGSWIKFRDPKKAEPIYQELVRRCGYTALGEEAKRIHWFPLH